MNTNEPPADLGRNLGLAQQCWHMARAACDALGLKFDETSPSEIKARIYEMWDGLNAKLNEPIPLEVAPPTTEEVAAFQSEIDKINIGPSVLIPMNHPKFRVVQWNPEDRDRRLRELVELFDGRIVDSESGGMSIFGLSEYQLTRISYLILNEFPGSDEICDRIRSNSFIPSSQEIPGRKADRV